MKNSPKRSTVKAFERLLKPKLLNILFIYAKNKLAIKLHLNIMSGERGLLCVVTDEIFKKNLLHWIKTHFKRTKVLFH